MRSVGLIWFSLFPGQSFSNMSLLGLPAAKRRRASAAALRIVKDEPQKGRGEQPAVFCVRTTPPSPSPSTPDTYGTVDFWCNSCYSPFRAQNVVLILIRAAPCTKVKRSLDGGGPWHDLCVPAEELRPENTLTIGQCFNWRQAGADCWVGVLDREVIAIRCEERSRFGRQ